MNKKYMTAALVLGTMLTMTACNGDVESKEEADTEVNEESASSEVYDKDGNKIADLKDVDEESDQPTENTKEKSAPKEYEGYADTLNHFELPEEGRLSEEEAEERTGMNVEGNSFDMVVYENGYNINKQAKKVESLTYIDGERPYPYGTQSLALFKTIIDTVSGEHAIVNNGEMIETKDVKSLEELSDSERDRFSREGGLMMIHKVSDRVIKDLRQFETYFSEQEYKDLTTWVEDTVDLYETALNADQSNWEEGYKAFAEGAQRIAFMQQGIEGFNEGSQSS
jgi:hypothetical protein